MRARQWLQAVSGRRGLRVVVERGLSTIGGGTTPGETLPTTVLSIRPVGSSRGWAARIAAELRHHAPPVLGRVEDGALVLDPRTVLPDQDAGVEAALGAVFAG
jgi:L-seryl-tRNA(Ser) seleniumtransferase